MNSEKWRSAWIIYEKLASVSPTEHIDAIRRHTDDPELIDCVLGILADRTQPAESAEVSMQGKQVGRYQIGEELGRGGMGVIYSAVDLQLERKVAIKFLSTRLIDARALDRFVREARAASALNHPNIVTIYDVIQDANSLAIVMEHVEGQTLRAAFRGPARPEDIKPIGRQIALALAAAHASNIVHRDVKPDNIMVRADGVVKLLDFGIAGLADTSAPVEPEARPGFTMPAGTPRYLAPEQFEARRVTPASDIFSFGVVLAELLLGKHPLDGALTVTQVSISFEGAATATREIHGKAPELARLVRAMLDERPEKRPDARTVAAALTAKDNRRFSPWMLAAAAASAVALLLVWLVSRKEGPAAPLVARQFTSLPGREIGSSFDPSSERIAFAWDKEADGEFDIYAQAIHGQTLTRITNEPGWDYDPVWSPDGRSMVYLHDSPPASEIVLRSLDTGAKRTLAKTNSRAYIYYHRLDWSPDGKWILYSDGERGTGRFTLFAVSVETGEQRKLGEPDSGAFFHQPAFSPDGRRIAFTWDWEGVSRLGIVEVDAGMRTTGKPWALQLTGFENTICSSPRWSRNGTQILFMSTKGTSANNLYIVDVPSDRNAKLSPTVLGAMGEGVAMPTFAPNGKALAYTKITNDPNTYQVEMRPPFTLRRIVASTRGERFAKYSPDGTRIVYESDQTGYPEIWLADADGGNAFALTSFRGPVTGSASWSPDGRTLAFDTRVDGQPEIYLIAAEAGAKPRRFTNDPAIDYMPSWSPDGQWIYFTSNRSGTLTVWRQPLNGGPAEQVTKTFGESPLVSPDAHWLYFSSNGSLNRMRLPKGPVQRIDGVDDNRAFGVSPRGVYYYNSPGRTRSNIRFYDSATGRSSLVMTLQGHFDSGLSLSPDGRFLMLQRVDSYGSDLMLVENFR